MNDENEAQRDYDAPTINVNMERNSRGVTWGVSVVGARSTKEAMDILDKTRSEMAHRFGDVSEVK